MLKKKIDKSLEAEFLKEGTKRLPTIRLAKSFYASVDLERQKLGAGWTDLIRVLLRKFLEERNAK